MQNKRDININPAKVVILLLLFFAAFLNTSDIKAQLKMPGTAYFQNQYLANPALAGMNQKKNLALSYGRLWNEIPGSPVTMSFTGDLGFKDNLGAGLIIQNDEADLLNRTRVMGSFAYHAAFTDQHKLHLGFSAGAVLEKLNMGGINGDLNDPLLNNFNSKGNYFEADFGAAYTFNDRLTIQAVLPNLVSQFSNSEGPQFEHTTYFAAISYKTKLDMDAGAEPIGVEPKLAVRGFNGYSTIVDMGANFSFMNELLQVSGIYHTSRSFTFGAGLNLKMNLSALVLYQTRSADLKGVSAGESFEFGLRYSF